MKREYFVITILDNPQSQQSADRCIASAKRYGYKVEKFNAITPRTEGFEDMVEEANLAIDRFTTKYSRPENALACYLSHRALWQKSVESKCEVMILEHDAIFRDKLPPTLVFDKCITVGEPSYGIYDTPTSLGVQPLTQKEYFKGAHAYIVKPDGAQDLLETCSDYNRPTDIYLNIHNFPYLEEYYPWAVYVDDHYTTIQTQNGIQAKHNFQKGRIFDLVEA